MGVLNERHWVSTLRLERRLGRVRAVEEVWDPDVESSTLSDAISNNLWVGDKTEDVCEEDDSFVFGVLLVGTLGEVGTILFGAFGGTWKPISRGTVRAVHGGRVDLWTGALGPFISSGNLARGLGSGLVLGQQTTTRTGEVRADQTPPQAVERRCDFSPMSFGRPPSLSSTGFTATPPDRGSFPLDHYGAHVPSELEDSETEFGYDLQASARTIWSST